MNSNLSSAVEPEQKVSWPEPFQPFGYQDWSALDFYRSQN
jgi:hypothetical protein